MGQCERNRRSRPAVEASSPAHVAAVQTRRDVLGQHLAQLHAPLVEAVDAPQRAADEHPVLVQREQRAQAGGVQPLQQEEACWAGCPGKCLWPPASALPCISAWACASTLASNCGWWPGRSCAACFTAMNSTGTTSVPWCSIWKYACWPLVPGSPHSTGEVAERQRRALRVDPLAVALHLQLLQVGRQPAQRAVVRRDAAAGEAVEIAVPDVQQPQAHRQVAAPAARWRSAGPSRGRPPAAGESPRRRWRSRSAGRWPTTCE